MSAASNVNGDVTFSTFYMPSPPLSSFLARQCAKVEESNFRTREHPRLQARTTYTLVWTTFHIATRKEAHV